MGRIIFSLENDLTRKVNNLERERDDWRAKFYDKSRECEEYKDKYDEKNEELQNEKLSNANTIADERLRHSRDMSTLQVENTRVKEQRDSFSSQLTNSENKVTRLGISLTEKNREMLVIANQLANLRLERNNWDNQLQNSQRELVRAQTERDERITATDLQDLLFGIENRDREINNLRENLGQSRESDFTERLNNKEREIERFAHRLGIDWEQIQLLRDICNGLVRSRKDGDINGIRTNQDIIATIKQNLLQTGVHFDDVQEICKKCEEIAQLNLQLEQQFEARIEVPTNH